MHSKLKTLTQPVTGVISGFRPKEMKSAVCLYITQPVVTFISRFAPSRVKMALEDGTERLSTEFDNELPQQAAK
jgi:hypothetical protein